jgi:hypothetical protein
MKMTSNGKTLNYKVVDLVESYNFHIKFTCIQVQTKNYKILKTNWTPTVMAHGGSSRYSTPARGSVATAVGPHDGRCIVLQFFGRTIYFCKIEKKKCKKIYYTLYVGWQAGTVRPIRYKPWAARTPSSHLSRPPVITLAIMGSMSRGGDYDLDTNRAVCGREGPAVTSPPAVSVVVEVG